MKLKFTALVMIIFSALTYASGQKAPTSAESAPVAKLPTIGEILAKYVTAIGGREANAKIKSRESKGTVELTPMGIKGSFVSIGAPDARSVTRMNLAGIGVLADGNDGTTAWSDNPIQGGRLKAGKELQQMLILSNFYREINLDKLYANLKVNGAASVDGKDVFIVEASNEGLPIEKFYFDSKTGYLLRTDSTIVSPEGDQPAVIHYEDFREVDGVKLPFRVRTKLPQFEIVVITTDIKHNIKLDEATFARPK
ncbi:hypothetical protein BH24ACI3_BH24ACI3_01780 [soil metagenome]